VLRYGAKSSNIVIRSHLKNIFVFSVERGFSGPVVYTLCYGKKGESLSVCDVDDCHLYNVTRLYFPEFFGVHMFIMRSFITCILRQV
jgi:hypothetical protein